MASPEVLNFQSLLTRISDDAPTGVALRADDGDPSFYQIKDARDDARSAEEQSILAELTRDDDTPAPPPSRPPDWQAVVNLGKEILSTKSMDIWIATWLIEGLARTDGFAGLRDGFRLIREMSEHYWDGLHPRGDDGSEDIAHTFVQLSGLLDGVLNSAIYAIPITGSCPQDEEDPTPRHSTLDFRQAEKLEKLADPKERSKRIDRGAVSKDDFSRAVEATSAASFQTLLGDIEGCLDEFGRMTTLLDEKCGREIAPPTTKTHAAITACRDAIKRVAKDKLEQAKKEGKEGKPESSDGPPTPVTPKPPSHLAGREEAFCQLLQVADFFRKSEPQSIVSYALEQVVRWGRMPLPELLKELSDNKSVSKALFSGSGTTGEVRLPAPENRPADRTGVDQQEEPDNQPEQPDDKQKNKLW